MIKQISGTYESVQKDYTLEIVFNYYWNKGDYDSAPDAELEVKEVFINSETVSLEFYYDFLHHQLEEQIAEYAQDIE